MDLADRRRRQAATAETEIHPIQRLQELMSSGQAEGQEGLAMEVQAAQVDHLKPEWATVG